MFKRVEKRIKRKEREDELGLDDDMKEILGLNDTDSDESQSDVDSDDCSVGEDSEAEEELDDDNDDETEEDLDQESDDDDDKSERSLVTVEEAFKDPVFIVSLDPDIKECIVCPGKLLKGLTMVEAHKSSNAHERRFKQFKTLAADADLRATAQSLVSKSITEKRPDLSAPTGTSKRAEKKRIAKEKRKTKREKFKARQKSKKESPRTEETSTLKQDEKTAGEKNKPPIEKALKKKPSKDPSSDKSPKSRRIQQASGTTDTVTSTRRDISESTEPPKKKRKTASSVPLETNSPPISRGRQRGRPVPPTAKKAKSKPEPTPPTESPGVIQNLQAQVGDIIKSASKLAKAARARALNGESGETKSFPVKKRKPISGVSTGAKSRIKPKPQKS